MYYKKDFTLKKQIKQIISSPFILGAIIPIIILDLWVIIYQAVAFPLYGIKKVKRKHYIKIDRHKQNTINAFEKFYCAYCGYANGAVHYWQEVIARTEQYWCGIKHKESKTFIPPKHHKNFAKYNNYKDLKEKYPFYNK